MAIPRAAQARPPALERLASHYLPDLVYGASEGIITTFAVVSGVVGASLSESVITILGLANLVADGFSMGASNYPRPTLESRAGSLGSPRCPAPWSRHDRRLSRGRRASGRRVPAAARAGRPVPRRDRSYRRRAVRSRSHADVRDETRPAPQRSRDAARRVTRRHGRLRGRRPCGVLHLALQCRSFPQPLSASARMARRLRIRSIRLDTDARRP